MRGLLALLIALLAAGCASNLPEPIREPPPQDLALETVRQDPEQYIGQPVRWGGTIAGVDNRADETCLEVVGRELQSSGKPVARDRSEGRFLACVNRFLDPMVYSRDRLVTVAGTVEAVETRPVGEYPYRYPVVQVQNLHLWQPETERPRYERDPFFYDPFWPWPYYRYPWFGPPPFGWYGYPR
jgi:outer membrane lipoprotein